MASTDPATRVTLLARLRDGSDAQAWAQFESIYRDMLIRFCRARGVQPADADDLVQAVFLKLVKGLRRFEYDPAKGRFRSYLFRCVHSVLNDWRHERTPGGAAIESLGRAEHAAADVVEPPDWEREWVDHHYRMAFAAVARTVDPRSAEVFEALRSGRSVEDVARDMGMTDQAVYKVQQRMRERLRELIRRQIDDENGDGP